MGCNSTYIFNRGPILVLMAQSDFYLVFIDIKQFERVRYFYRKSQGKNCF